MSPLLQRWFWSGVCILFGILMLVCGWVMPIHLRAVDGSVLERSGRDTPSLAEHTLELIHQGRTTGVPLLLKAAIAEEVPGFGKLPADSPGSSLALAGHREVVFPAGEPATRFVIRLENRERLLEILGGSSLPVVQELMRTRALTNTVLFPPSSSSSGQAYDAAVSVAGLLLEGGRLSPNLSGLIEQRAGEANRGEDSAPLESILMDLLSLGQRFDFGELATLVGHVQKAQTLQVLAGVARNAGERLPELYAAVDLTQQPDAVAAYLQNFSQTGLADVGRSLRFGEGGVDELLRRNQRLYEPAWRARWTASGPAGLFYQAGTDYAWRIPWFALALKWCFYISCGFLLALSAHLVRRPVVDPLEQRLEARGAHWARELLFALGFLLVVLLLSEPFLAQESQKAEFPFRLRLPALGAAATSAPLHVNTKIMDTNSLLTLLLFFVLQALIYTACRVKLAEIRRQRVPARVRLKLLENEEHLFDAGLYLGFAGTVGSLVLLSLRVIQQQSLMAAYSSTAFGIIFVAFLKIFNLRPLRRELLLQSEKEPREAAAEGAATTFATSA